MAGSHGQYLIADGEIELVPGRPRRDVRVRNTGDRPIQVGSHFHFFETNRALAFDRAAAFGMRLDIPSGTAARFEPGDERDVPLVAFGGNRRAIGFNGLTNGDTTADEARVTAMATLATRGFADDGSGDA